MSIRLKELDALRGFAALFVVLFHLTMGNTDAQFFLKYGVTGVELFFIISGFVIFMSINKVKSVLEFFINRFSRLYPTYWFSVTFTFIISIIVFYRSTLVAIPFLKYFANMTMFQYYLKVENIDDCYWTMIVEMLFYILIALIYFIKQIKHILPIGLIIVSSSIILDSYFESYFLFINNIFPLFAHFPLFLSGIIFYKITHLTISEDSSTKKSYYFGIAYCFIAQLLLFDKGRCIDIIVFYEYIPCLIVYYSLFILFVNNRLQVIITKPTLFLGKISFALYLIHQYVSNCLIIPILTNYVHISLFIATTISIVFVIIIAAVITFHIEIPYNKKINEFLRTKFKLYKNQ